MQFKFKALKTHSEKFNSFAGQAKASGFPLRSLGILLAGALQSYRDLLLERNGELQAF